MEVLCHLCAWIGHWRSNDESDLFEVKRLVFASENSCKTR